MNNLNANYKRILEVLREQFLPYQRRQPKMSDLELVSLSLTAEFIGMDSENDLFRKLPENISSKIEPSVYNRRRRRLVADLDKIRLKLASDFNEFENYFVVDSMPLEVCKLSRSSRSKICKQTLYASPDKGYCALQNSHYYGYKLHAICSVEGVFQAIDLSPASIHNINYLKDIKMQISDCTLIGDRGYLSVGYQLNLFEYQNIILETPMKVNQHNYKE